MITPKVKLAGSQEYKGKKAIIELLCESTHDRKEGELRETSPFGDGCKPHPPPHHKPKSLNFVLIWSCW
jgi:hypothetical protein